MLTQSAIAQTPHPQSPFAIAGSRKLAASDAAAIGVVMSFGRNAEIYAEGGELDWRRIHPAGRPVPLPNYPWQRQHVWRESGYQRADRLGASAGPLQGLGLPGTASRRADLACSLLQ